MSRIQKIVVPDEENDWTQLPLYSVLYRWMVKNASIPTDISIVIAYIGLFIIIWYFTLWLGRFIMRIIWPLLLVASAIVVFRVLQNYEPVEIFDIIQKSFTATADAIFLIMSKFFELMQKLFE
ncbi:uncharacterized protein LOC131994095 isoform X2 [Stomoxys calcitrans]|uniref:uncharacterized protein LOC131994095 isoform X2 n=1 Tax=Stomoxys calcitrans TaxID=35570 RepID=UPI0027E33504|nr:uncharacterized protein LOC131994095 isoform X2 [Stomoxys calcitrans]